MKVVFKGEENTFRNAKNFRELLTEALEKAKPKISDTDFNNPNWPHWRAYTDGKIKALDSVIEMLKD